MGLRNRPQFPLFAAIAVSLLTLAFGCGGDSSDAPVYSGSSIYFENRESGPVLVYEISIADSDGNPYTKGLLVAGTAFTPGSVFPVIAANKSGKATFVLEPTIAGDYRIAIESFTDTQGQTFTPSPGDTDFGGKLLLIQTYDPSTSDAGSGPTIPEPAK